MNQTRKTQITPKFTAYMAVSIDGVLAENGKSGNRWTSREDQAFFQKALSKHDGFATGYNTFKIAEKKVKKRRNVLVFTSKKRNKGVPESVTFADPKRFSPRKFFTGRGCKNVAVLGGPGVYAYFLEHGLLDELFITVEPYVFTKGVPMFFGSKFKAHSFVLKSARRLNKNGTLLLKYKHAS